MQDYFMPAALHDLTRLNGGMECKEHVLFLVVTCSLGRKEPRATGEARKTQTSKRAVISIGGRSIISTALTSCAVDQLSTTLLDVVKKNSFAQHEFIAFVTQT